jgi:serine protease AprX
MLPRPAVLALGALLAWLAPASGSLPPHCAGDLPTTVTTRTDAPRVCTAENLRVVIQAPTGMYADTLVREAGGAIVWRLEHVGAMVADVPTAALGSLQAAAAAGAIGTVAVDRPLEAALDRTADTVGARWVQEHLGFDGTGVGVAIIDSGVVPSHADLSADRVVHFMDFVAFGREPYDGYGHGTHVAGIIAADGATLGIAPGADLVVLKTLDHQGQGYISDAIAAIDYAIAQQAAYNIRVVNLSVTAGVYESYRTDPLALAAARAVEAGIVVVTAAGNLGRNAAGDAQHGGVTAPGNAPWVLTVGAASNGELATMSAGVAAFSSLGPSAIDLVEKPDLVAPGTDIVSLADPDGLLYLTRPGSRRSRGSADARDAHLSLSGTSMAAPVVAGGVAVMMQANPALSPSAVKAILQATADPLDGYTRLAQGAGRLNLRDAVALAATADPGAWHAPNGREDVPR